jgi:Holliday junction resolvase-like predicted endonuclease
VLHLQQAGLRLLDAVIGRPERGGVSLIMRAPDATVVFIEVRQHRGALWRRRRQRKLTSAAPCCLLLSAIGYAVA